MYNTPFNFLKGKRWVLCVPSLAEEETDYNLVIPGCKPSAVMAASPEGSTCPERSGSDIEVCPTMVGTAVGV